MCPFASAGCPAGANGRLCVRSRQPSFGPIWVNSEVPVISCEFPYPCLGQGRRWDLRSSTQQRSGVSRTAEHDRYSCIYVSWTAKHAPKTQATTLSTVPTNKKQTKKKTSVSALLVRYHLFSQSSFCNRSETHDERHTLL